MKAVHFLLLYLGKRINLDGHLVSPIQSSSALSKIIKDLQSQDFLLKSSFLPGEKTSYSAIVSLSLSEY